jgi:hypothetical protein
MHNPKDHYTEFPNKWRDKACKCAACVRARAETAAQPDTLRERLEGLQAAVKHLDDLCRQCRCMGSEGWHKYCDYSENVVRPLLASAPAPATPPFGSQVEDFLGLSEDEVKRAIQPAMPVEAREVALESALRNLLEQFYAYSNNWLGPDSWRWRIGLRDDLQQAEDALALATPSVASPQAIADDRMSADWRAGYEKAKSEFYNKGFTEGAQYEAAKLKAAAPIGEPGRTPYLDEQETIDGIRGTIGHLVEYYAKLFQTMTPPPLEQAKSAFSGHAKACLWAGMEIAEKAAAPPAQGAPTPREVFLAKYDGICPCCQNVKVTNSDKGEGVPCPYCVTGELSWKLAAQGTPETREALHTQLEGFRNVLCTESNPRVEVAKVLKVIDAMLAQPGAPTKEGA